MATQTGRRTTRKQKRRAKRRHAFLKIVLFTLLMVTVVAVIYVITLVNKINFHKLSRKDAGINKDLDEGALAAMEGYTNIAIFGLDNRSAGNYETGNADTIMIASINNQTKEVKLVSVYRDTMLNVGDNNYKKANHAYAMGGPRRAVAMLNSNLDLDITEYVCVDWLALVAVIDDLGGLDLEVKETEAKMTNKYLWEVDKMTGKETKPLEGSGLMHLDGTQALCYARIRKLAGNDFLRTSRQRIVVEAIMRKAQNASITELNKICNDVFPMIATTLSVKDILGLAKDIGDYNIAETTGFPFLLTCKRIEGQGDMVIPCTLDNNVEQLHEFLFDDTSYKLSNTVKAHNKSIAGLTGVATQKEAIDISNYNNTAGANGTGFSD